MHSNNDLQKLIESLPFFVQKNLNQHIFKNQIVEIILDLGRRPEARFLHGPEYLSQKLISWQEIEYVTKQVSKFSNENRAGIERTLHRISCIRNRQFLIHGLTCRVGRSIFGTISIIHDLLQSGKSILVLGKPGVGKTTIIREISRVLADEMEKRVIIIDTSNEIAGDSDIPHVGIGRARRMQVPKTELQHHVMIEAVENHMPQVIVIDEIGTDLEVLAARTIAEKGVQLVGTTHGNCLDNLIKNPSLSDLIGGIQYVTLSDEEAKRRKTQKSILERKAYPAFEIIIEINSSNVWTIHENTKNSIDNLLRNEPSFNQVRQVFSTKRIQIKCNKNFYMLKPSTYLVNNIGLSQISSWNDKNIFDMDQMVNSIPKQLVIYSYSISHIFLQEVFSKLETNFVLTNTLANASLIIGLKKSLKHNLKLKKLAAQKEIPIYSLNQLNLYQFFKFMKKIQN